MAVKSLQDGQEDTFDQLDQLGQPHFDPVQFLNDTLPTLNLTSQVTLPKTNRSATLQSTSTDVQTFLSKLNTHSIRSSSELTSLTDEILRSGNRLAYEVEVLRGDVNSLYESLTDSLKDDIARFVFEEVAQEQITPEGVTVLARPSADEDRNLSMSAHDPEFIRQLRLLGTVKSRLEAVIHVFGESLKWPVAPSEVSMAASLISVSAPELGVVNSAEDDKAHEYTRKLRNEMIEALDSDGAGSAGVEAGTKKVNELRALSQVWKGTAEEKARSRVVDNLGKLVEERKKAINARPAPAQSSVDGSSSRSSSIPGRAGRIVEGSSNTAAGLFRNLQKLRDEIYQD